MELAFAGAKKVEVQDEVSIGAVVVDPKGQAVGRGYNHRELDNVATRHAKTLAISEACKTLNSWRSIDCSLFATLGPCAMHVDAIVNAHLKEVFYGAPNHEAGTSGSIVDLLAVEKFNHHPRAARGLHRDKAGSMSTNFFGTIKAKQKEKKLRTKGNKASSSQIN